MLAPFNIINHCDLFTFSFRSFILLIARYNAAEPKTKKPIETKRLVKSVPVVFPAGGEKVFIGVTFIINQFYQNEHETCLLK